ncbi:uncharacterized protein MKK02DRAFT_39753 [Dioszegia hungarica]|uniref:Uncharacterized protein n=1 Tax=Dioszegia hungarica TaxID=4972 RepID=A0AA38HFB5_9TREE|nr:uncharacterized protein MKK02DRAFT_39753 [Dioszegia hungarica]KAI9639455.1 hypothetical protein MKK02DRAFT_39753 [Dioszegia hungarica]
MGLRKPKSEKDLRGKLRKPRASDEASTASSRHQRLPSVPPIIPLPSHIARIAPVPTHIPTSPTLRPRHPAKRAVHHHRRSRSFSTLTSMISPTLSAFSEQPWRSRDAWLAIHARPSSPPPVTVLPTAPGGSDKGWRRKGNGGFFARELAGVGEAALPLPQMAPGRLGMGMGRSQTTGDLAGAVERPEVRRMVSEPSQPELLEDEGVKGQGPGLDSSLEGEEDQLAQLHLGDWKPGFASSLFRKKTHRASLPSPPHADSGYEEEIITPPAPSRPESHLLPESPPPPPAFKRHLSTSRDPPIQARSYSTLSGSVRTSQSSSVHTYETSDLEHHHQAHAGSASGGGCGVDDPAGSRLIVSTSSTSSELLSPSSRPTSLSRHSDILEAPPKRSSSLLAREDLPTIITPTSKYYHFTAGTTSARSSIDIHPHTHPDTVAGHFDRRGSEADIVPYKARTGPPRRALPKLPHEQHGRDESLPPLLPPADIARVRSGLSMGARLPVLPEGGGGGGGGVGAEVRMKGVPWARAVRKPDEGEEGRQRVMRQVTEMEAGLGARGQEGAERWSRGSDVSRRGSEASQGVAVRGGWV